MFDFSPSWLQIIINDSTIHGDFVSMSLRNTSSTSIDFSGGWYASFSIAQGINRNFTGGISCTVSISSSGENTTDFLNGTYTSSSNRFRWYLERGSSSEMFGSPAYIQMNGSGANYYYLAI